MSKSPKIFVPLDGDEAKKNGPELLKRLIKIIFERGMQANRENKPLPSTFIDLFGKDIDARGIGKIEAKDLMKGEVLKKREHILLNFIEKVSGTSLLSSTIINESMLFDVPGVISINIEEIKGKGGNNAQ